MFGENEMFDEIILQRGGWTDLAHEILSLVHNPYEYVEKWNFYIIYRRLNAIYKNLFLVYNSTLMILHSYETFQ